MAGQREQAAAPPASLTLPAAQDVHAEEPAEALMLPALQATHGDWPPGPELPAAHFSQAPETF